ncbi:hypothetical protein ABZS96_28955 [Streptomyces avermitilis]|uniref:hypothetical protein n=1 Tax=Streptomyces avermitilis TaxID=33903 RepID=UPI0033B6B508
MPAAQIAAGLIVAGGGTGLATAVTHGSVAPQPAAAATATTDDDASVALNGSKLKIDLAGLDLDFGEQLLLKTRLELGTVSERDCRKNGKRGSAIAIGPHSPKTVDIGDTINLTRCAG